MKQKPSANENLLCPKTSDLGNCREQPQLGNYAEGLLSIHSLGRNVGNGRIFRVFEEGSGSSWAGGDQNEEQGGWC